MKTTCRPSDASFVVVIDNHPLVLEATGGLLRSWGCSVAAGESYSAMAASLAEHGRRPDLIVCDYHLTGPETGIDAIERLRHAFGHEIPALLVTTEFDFPRHFRETENCKFLSKPVNAENLRAALLETADLHLR
jgi:two-component system, sensor histidine kinase